MNFKGKRFCQRTSRGCLNFLHKQVFRCCSLLCIPPVSLAPIFITFFVWLFFGCVFGLFLGGGVVYLFVLNLSVLAAKKALQKARRLELHSKQCGGGEGQCNAGCQQNFSLPPQILVVTVSCSLMCRSLLCEDVKGKSGKRVKAQKASSKVTCFTQHAKASSPSTYFSPTVQRAASS